MRPGPLSRAAALACLPWLAAACAAPRLSIHPGAPGMPARPALTAVAISPDGRAVAFGTGRGEILVWDPSSGGRIEVRQGTGAPVREIEFDAAGPRAVDPVGLASSAHWRALGRGDGALELRRADGELAGTIAGAGAQAAAFSGDGRWLLSGGDDARISVWELPALKLRQRITEERLVDVHYWTAASEPVRRIRPLPDGGVLFSTPRSVALGRLGPADSKARLGGSRSGEIFSFAVHPNGARFLTAGSDGTATVFKLSPHSVEIVAELFVFADGEWLFVDPAAARFDGSPGAPRYCAVTEYRGRKRPVTFPLERYAGLLREPGLAARRLNR